MSTTETLDVSCIDVAPGLTDLAAEVVRSLQQTPKRLPCTLFYDGPGARLFEQITGLEEYYLTRVETAILQSRLAEIAALCGPNCLLVEPGSGASGKSRLLLSALQEPAGYMPVDICREQLLEAALRLKEQFPSLQVAPLWADYHKLDHLPFPERAARRTVVFFPGSTLGNFEPAAASYFLRRLGRWAGSAGGILLGLDLQKDRQTLERAYNDRQGVTAAFNLNMLHRLNREFNAGFEPLQFRHQAVYNERPGRIEMRLISLRRQQIRQAGIPIWFEEGEAIVTEHSYKYTLEGLRRLAGSAGLEVHRLWTDPKQWFAVAFLKKLQN